ncbi:leucyl aminopeptidase family protein [Polymorphobacter fuscus]|uniref:Leucyl aminopeptidase family protein n=1 Tax=Sandarakinorhabdus fusca TaxID=1439888 RepID=A0A7C9GQL1_9SPHN|nr:leucyl aminopeptidase family protein [Polymorphobacter fuscus]KAB7646467.1 leucyl aminopeptidase family protein [Polymorphobacter fuscus]MQT17710.1 leucyl aminopeptidase family protein [Polymorphobacter fuscus]NJC09742.1 leucyl aminopeptidase [Polymorphobacter fuscus]
MTDFAALLIPDDGGPATDLTLATAGGFRSWLGSAGTRTRSLLAAQGFTAKPDTLAILPGDDPADWSAIAGIEADHGPFALAAAAAALPGGRYRLRTTGDMGAVAFLGWLLAQHRFERYRKAGGDTAPRVLLTGDIGRITAAVRLAEATALVRDLVDTPASDLGPAALADAVIAEGRRCNARVDVITGEALLGANFPAVHAVGRAASQAPRIIDLHWGNADHPRLTLVGKGVTFDSGGLNIKPGGGMALMKKDMGGAAHALALARLVMQADLPVRLRLIVPAVENAIAGNAMRPGDILATRAGKTIEVTNTDAEGRLILADALTLAGEDSPDLIIDFATLTGAARVALGPQLPALFTNDERLAADFAAAAAAAGDPIWRLPLWPGYRDMLKSSVADMVNAPDGGFAGAVTAALFLEAFVGEGQRWAHFDTFAWNPAPRPGRPKGGEALGLRAAWALVQKRFLEKEFPA